MWIPSVTGWSIALLTFILLCWVLSRLVSGIRSGYYPPEAMLIRHEALTLALGALAVLIDVLAAPYSATYVVEAAAVLGLLGVLISALVIDERHEQYKKMWQQLQPILTP